MNESQFSRETGRRRVRAAKNNALAAGIVIILGGLLLLGRNTGLIDQYIYRIVVSWPAALILVGVVLLARKNYAGGLLAALVGAFFLIPLATGAGPEWTAMYKPLLLILIGLLIVVKILSPRRHRRPGKRYDYSRPTRSASGFVEVNSVLGNYENIVLDEVFTGASIKGTLGGTVLDLRHTTIPEGETYIDVDTTFSGLVLHVPGDWEVVSRLRTTLAGLEDKRNISGEESTGGRRLVLRGNVTLGGVEIKN